MLRGLDNREEIMTELAIPEDSTSITSITPAQFDQAIAEAHLKAAQLKEIVEQAKLYVAMGAGKKYLMVEAWQTIGVAYGLTARIDWSRQFADRAGWEARATVIRNDGIEVAAAEAECGSTGDAPWNKRPEFQQRSMAQTRAISKALRSCLSWVVVLAGYQATPADEMPDSDEMPIKGSEPAADLRLVTEPQLRRLMAISNESPLDEDTIRIWMQAKYRVKTSKELTRNQYDEFITWIEAGGTEPQEAAQEPQEAPSEAVLGDGDVDSEGFPLPTERE
jgi:hypothetical protein